MFDGFVFAQFIHLYISIQFNSFQSLSCVRLFVTPWTAARQVSLSLINTQSLLKFMSIEPVMPSSQLIFCHPLLLLPSIFLSIRVFSNVFFTWGGQSTGASALVSFLPKKSQGWSLSEWTGWISLLSKGLSRVFSNTTVQSIISSVFSFLYSPTLTSICDNWKNHSFD